MEYPYRWNRSALGPADGYRRCTEIMSEALGYFGGAFAREFDQFLEHNTVMTHTMLFTHLGSPESITLVKKNIRNSNAGSEAYHYWRRRDGEP